MKKIVVTVCAFVFATSMAACGSKAAPAATTAAATTAAPETIEAQTTATPETAAAPAENTEVYLFAAASLQAVMEEFEKQYETENPSVDIVINADSSGKLLAQIQEGAVCDLFFSAGQKQMDALEKDEMLIEGSRKNVLNNQLVVITQPDTESKVTGLENIEDAESFALADGSVPVGKYTRRALINLGKLEKIDKPEDYTTEQVSEALGGIEISEQGNVSKVRSAVEEGSCEVGTVYYSDTYGHEDKVKIIQTVSYDVAGNIIYPAALVKNEEASEAQRKAAEDFFSFITNEDAKKLYQTYLFDTDVE